VWYWEKVSLLHMDPAMPRHEHTKPVIQHWYDTRAKQHTRITQKYKFGEGNAIHLQKGLLSHNILV
jgi:hypothetical protein